MSDTPKATKQQAPTPVQVQPEIGVRMEPMLTAYARVVNAIKSLNRDEKIRVINAASVTVI